MYECKKYLGFVGSSGTKWCKKTNEGKNIEVALVRKNGNIIWYLPEKKQPKELVEKIMKNSQAEKKKVEYWKDDLLKKEKMLEVVKKDSLEYFNILHSIFWYKDALTNVRS